MNEIIKVKPEWEIIFKHHVAKNSDIQKVVDYLAENGLKVTLGDIHNLINGGTALYEQAVQAAKSDAGIFKLPAAKKKFIEENTQLLKDCICEAKKKLTVALALERLNPLQIEAFELNKGIVNISEQWVENLKESHTIRSTVGREQALVLMRNVKEAVNALNDFVKDNPRFGAGVSTSDDTRNCLVWFNGKGELNFDIENLEFVE